ncbi:30S ribosomal protein S1 [SCandidatus Aminicenantes bacterium Aminicenantia_JdfR_composite]|nr:30S ribosomal protein S1 [SCandidatus Aminicenantes bacterium Aminicenantia_JdfR_composite]MCP2596831.1 30S ribosomal protein S1 [Candidatus Aminicenantes bacterium AC-335-G13]
MDELRSKEEKEELTPEDYIELIEKYQCSLKDISEGNIIQGRVVKIRQDDVLVDIGYKTEGVVPIQDFVDWEGKISVNEGDTINAMVMSTNYREGYVLLSKKKAEEVIAWSELEKAYAHNGWVKGRIIQRLKNGYTVDVGVKAFLPKSHINLRKIKGSNNIIGQELKFKVLKLERRNNTIILSYNLYLQDEKEKAKRRVFSNLEIGKLVKGKITSITNFGAFVDLGGIEGLLHINDMSWGRISHPSEMFSVGQEIEVVVLNFNEEEERIALGYKQKFPDPWESVEEKYKIGERIKGKVVSLADFGAFVEIEEGVEGLIHISDLTWSRKQIHPKKILSIGDIVEVVILDINAKDRRMSLGLKQTRPHPWKIFAERYKEGSIVRGKITKITDFGAFLQVQDEIEGLIHISDISWEKIKHPSEVLQVGQEVEAIILKLDPENQKLSLGIKQLEGDKWEEFFEKFKLGDIVDVKITRVVNFGVFGEIFPGIEGLIHLSELSEERIDNPAQHFSEGDIKPAMIVRIDQKNKKIALSFKRAQEELVKREYQKYLQSGKKTVTLGDIMRAKLKNLPINEKTGNNKEENNGKS